MSIFGKKVSSAKRERERERERESCCTVKRKGFTIIQMVIGMLIFAILTGIAFYGISVYTAQANETRVDSDLGTFEVAIKDYMLNNPNACSDGKLTPAGLNHYLTKENTLTSDTDDDDIGSEVSVSAGVGGEVAYKKLSTLEDPWGHQYRVVIRNNADRQDSDGEYGAKGTDRAFIYVYSMGKDGKGAAEDTKQDDSVLVVQYSDGEVFSKVYLPSDSKNQSVTAPAYTYWNKDDNGKHSVMRDSIFAVGAVDPSKAPGKENGSSGGSGGGSSNVTSSYAGWYVTNDYVYMRTPTAGNELSFTSIEEGKRFIKEVYIKIETGMTWDEFVKDILSDPDNEGSTEEELESEIYAEVGLDESTFAPATLSDEWTVVCVIDKEKTSYGALEAMINGYPVTSLAETFKDCTNMKKAPSIPASVKNMSSTFEGCTSLTGTITLDCELASLDGCFKDTVKPIVLSGESPNLYGLAATGNNGNVTVAKPTKPSKSMQWGYNVLGGNNVEIRTRTAADVSDEELSATAKKMAEENNLTEYFNGDYSAQNILKVYFELQGGQASDAPEPGDAMYDFFVEGLKTSYCIMTPKGDLVIPSRLNEDGYYDKNGKYIVTAIADNAFEYNDDITYIGFPSTLAAIGNKAFYDCRGLSEVAFGENIISIGESAFRECSKLQGALEIPNSVKTVGSRAFETCGITSVKIGDGITSIEANTFSNCFELVSIRWGKNITSIADNAFSYCGSLPKVVIPDSVTSIGGDAFSHCYKLSDIKLPNTPIFFKDGFSDATLANINDAFSGCPITNIDFLPNYITGIGHFAFSYCHELVNVTIPSRIKTIGEAAFWACGNLESVIIQDGVKTIESDAFRCCDKLESITIPCSVTSIDWLAFFGCANLTEINYLGTMNQWNSIIRCADWDLDTGDYVVKCTDGTISKKS